MVGAPAASENAGTVLAALEVRFDLDLPFELLPADYVLMRVDGPDPASIDPAEATVGAG